MTLSDKQAVELAYIAVLHFRNDPEAVTYERVREYCERKIREQGATESESEGKDG